MDVGIEDVYLSTAAQVELKGNPDSDKNVKYVLEDIENEIEDGHYADDRYTSEDQGGEENTPESISVGNDGRGNENIEPFLGMEFETQCAARSYYNDYAKRAGFGTRISYSHRSKRDRKMIGQQYVCVKEGFPMSKEGPSKIPRSSARIGCKASMTVKRENCGKWVVRGFEKDHNHDLASPEEVQFLRSHRGISSAAVNLISNIPGLATHLSNIINKSGGNSEVKSQVSSGVQKQWKRKEENIASDDVNLILDFFNIMQSENPTFLYDVQFGEGDCLANTFWVDARSRIAYEAFGDVLIFDTTYLADKYQVPLTTFVGVNHHEQPVLFGCALLTDQTKTSYIWLFKTWLAAMLDRHPQSIITCRNKVIEAAVAEIFPDTNHRFCLWDIQREMSDKLVGVASDPGSFLSEVSKCVYQTGESEFEACWALLLDRFDVINNDWFQLLYEDRNRWVPAYLKPSFFAEMPTAPKSRPIESIFESRLTDQTTLRDFLKEYNLIIDNSIEKEVEADHQIPILTMSLPLVERVASLYTKEAFEKLEAELVDYFNYVPNRVAEDGTMNVYVVAKYGEEKSHTVTFDFTDMRGSCSCQMFEFTGILCRHIVSVLTVEQVTMLPSHYILKRWTRNARIREVFDECSIDVAGISRQSVVTRYNDLCHRFIRLADEGARSVHGYNTVMRSLDATLKDVGNVNNCASRSAQVSTLARTNDDFGRRDENGVNLEIPTPSKTKGRTSSKTKGRLEDTRRMDTCNSCMKPGHYSRTCPTLASMETDIIEDIQMGQLDWV